MDLGLNNLSKREKIMLSILGILIVCFFYYQFGYEKLTAIAENKLREKNEVEEKYNNAIEIIKGIENQESNLKILNSQIADKTDPFYPTISQEHFVLEIDKIIKDCDMDGGINFNLSELEPVNVIKPSENDRSNLKSSIEKITQEYKDKNQIEDKETALNGKSNSSNSSKQSSNDGNLSDNNLEEGIAAIVNMKATVKFYGNYEEAVKFLNTLKERQKKICVYSVNMQTDTLENVKGEFKVIFYSLPKLDNEKNQYLKWNINNVYGKLEPFQFDAAAGENIKSKIPESDFVVSAKPLDSNLPTVTLGRAGDGARNSYIYADGNNVQKAEIVLSQIGDKYYYKYKTVNGKVPSDYNDPGKEFIPYRNSIDINIMSESRISDNDKSGIKLSIENNTDKLVKVNITGDDKQNPRVSIDGNKKNVVVSKE